MICGVWQVRRELFVFLSRRCFDRKTWSVYVKMRLIYVDPIYVSTSFHSPILPDSQNQKGKFRELPLLVLKTNQCPLLKKHPFQLRILLGSWGPLRASMPQRRPWKGGKLPQLEGGAALQPLWRPAGRDFHRGGWQGGDGNPDLKPTKMVV